MAEEDWATIGRFEFCRGVLREDLSIPQHVLELCPRNIAIDKCVLPLDCSEQGVLLAMHDPDDIGKVDELCFVIRRPLRILQIDEHVLHRHVKMHYNSD